MPKSIIKIKQTTDNTGLGGGGVDGNGFLLGPTTNVFTGADKAAAEAARDAYATANPTWLAEYNSDTALNIRLEYSDGTNQVAVYQVRNSAGDAWLENESFEAVKGDNGELASLDGVTVGHVPYKLPDGTFGDSGALIQNDTFTVPGELQTGLSTILLGRGSSVIHSISSAGEQIVFANRSSGIPYTPGSWSNGSPGTDWTPTTRIGGTYHERQLIEADDATTLTNPSFDFSLPLNYRVYSIYIKVVTPATSCYFLMRQGGAVVFESKRFDYVAGEFRMNLQAAAGGQGFMELRANETYQVQILSDDGDATVLGNSTTSVPWHLFDWQEWEDVPLLHSKSTEGVSSPTFVAVNSTDPDIVYGAFVTTGVVRKRVLSTGVDTYFTSSVTLPVTNEATWTDWQNRETLTYGVI
ncbi:hypothetical protein NVP1031O_153 [Vibrio phage 1.031.O._10N.261.46.F8]|nr:hypothetical protein NVP1031O_153 [Vibrio phage 1.031.O._10N.261.46.F8]